MTPELCLLRHRRGATSVRRDGRGLVLARNDVVQGADPRDREGSADNSSGKQVRHPEPDREQGGRRPVCPLEGHRARADLRSKRE